MKHTCTIPKNKKKSHISVKSKRLPKPHTIAKVAEIIENKENS